MLKKKTYLFIAAAIIVLFAAMFCTKFSFAKADDTQTEAVETVETGFSFADGEQKILDGFTVPADVTGYFKVKIPDGVTRINTGSFVGGNENVALSAMFLGVEVPASVTDIQPNAFSECNSLIEVCLPAALQNAVGDSGLISARTLSIVNSAEDLSLATKSDGNGAYIVVRNGGAQSTKWTIFEYIGSAENITLPQPTFFNDNCTGYGIYENAFRNVISSLKSVVLPEGLEEIGAYAFSGSKLSTVNIPSSVKSIGQHAFNGCSSLTSVSFAERTEELTISHDAFASCAMKVLYIPENTSVFQYAFRGCNSLSWVYVGDGTSFINTAAGDDDSAIFFPTNTNITVIYSSSAEFDKMLAQGESTFKNNNGSSATYIVDVNCYIGSAETPVTYKRLHGESFNFVCDEGTGNWNTDTAFSALPVQAANYSSTVWYKQSELTDKIGYDEVNALLATESKIDLFCYETVTEPVLPAEPATWVYDKNKTYDITDLSEVLKAMGCEEAFTEAQLKAMQFEVVYADADSNVSEKLPSAICENGVYSVTVTLNSEYGVWTKPVSSTVTVNVNTGSFNAVLIVFLVIGVLAIGATVATAVVRKKVQSRSKKKQLSSKEVLEKFRAIGEETTLK